MNHNPLKLIPNCLFRRNKIVSVISQIVKIEKRQKAMCLYDWDDLYLNSCIVVRDRNAYFCMHIQLTRFDTEKR